MRATHRTTARDQRRAIELIWFWWHEWHIDICEMLMMREVSLRNIFHLLSVVILTALIIFIGIVIQFLWQPIVPKSGKGLYYLFEPGKPLRSLINDLQMDGYLTKPNLFKALAYSKRVSRKVQAGEYYFPPGTTPNQLLTILSSGKVVQHKLTLIEGWTFLDVLDELKRNTKIKSTLGGMPPNQLMQEFQITHKNLEGLFYPETYEFPYGITDKDFLIRAHRLLKKRLAKAWDERAPNLPYQEPYQAIIVASLIEKETADPDERYLISSVIVNRLKRNMHLQIDPSVIYGLYNRFIPVLSRYDLQIDTAYNTYLHKGLPPTPIAMPSLKSIDAALHPADTTYLFFVLKENGKHQFSSTYAEHLKAVKQYREIKRYRQSFRENA